MANKEDIEKDLADLLKKVKRVEVVDPGSKFSVLVCMRVEDLPIPRVEAVIEQCATCHQRVWVSKKSPAQPKRMCYQCFVPMAAREEELIVGMTPYSAKILGVCDEGSGG